MLMLDGVKAAGKGICWAVYWHEGKVTFNQPHKAGVLDGLDLHDE